MKPFFRELFNTSDSNFKELLKGSGWAFIMIVIGTAIQFIFDLLLARTFGADGSGAYYLIYSVLILVSTIVMFGFDKIIFRFVPKLLKNSDKEQAGAMISRALLIVLTFSLIAALTIFLGASTIAESIFNKPELTAHLKISAFTIPGLSMTLIVISALKSLKLIRIGVFIERVSIYLMMIFIVLISALFMDLKYVFNGLLITTYIAFIHGYIIIQKKLPHKSKTVTMSFKELIVRSYPLFLVLISIQLMDQIGTVILGIYSTKEIVGVYNVAIKVSKLLTIVLTAINAINASLISETYEDTKSLQNVMGKSAALSFLLGLPILLIFILFPRQILGLFGTDFTGGFTVLMIIGLAQFFSISVGSVNLALGVSGHEKVLAKYTIVISIFSVLLNIILISKFELLGAGIAFALMIFLRNLVYLFLVKKHLGVWSLPFTTLSKWLKVN